MLYLYISDPFELSCKSAPCFYSVFYSVGVSALFVTSQNELQTSPFVNDSNVTICAPFFLFQKNGKLGVCFRRMILQPHSLGKKANNCHRILKKKFFFLFIK